MRKLNVLLVYGSEASSGLMVISMRGTTVAKGLGVDIKAGSESEIENCIEDIGMLMVGPHLAHTPDEVEKHAGGLDVKVISMDPDYYFTLNGDKAIDHLLSEMEQYEI